MQRAGPIERGVGGPVAVLPGRRPRELQEDVVEGRPAEPEVADPDPFAAQLRGGVLDQLEAVPWGRHRQPVRTLVRLGIPTAHPGERLLSELALGGVRKLDLEDLAADLFLELVPRARGDHPAVVDHRDPLGELVGLLQVLGGQKQRGALALEVSNRIPDLVAAARVEPGGRLVEEEDPGLRQQARAQVEPPSHPPGVGPGRAVGCICQIEVAEQPIGAFGRLLPGEVEESPEHLEVLAPGQQLVDGSELAGQGDLLANCGRLLGDVLAEDLGSARIRRDERGKDPDEGGLARAVRAEQPEDGSFRNLEIDSRQRLGFAEALRDPLDPDRRTGAPQLWGLPGRRHGHLILGSDA